MHVGMYFINAHFDHAQEIKYQTVIEQQLKILQTI